MAVLRRRTAAVTRPARRSVRTASLTAGRLALRVDRAWSRVIPPCRSRLRLLVEREVVVRRDEVPVLCRELLLQRVAFHVIDPVPHLAGRVQEHLVRTRGD